MLDFDGVSITYTPLGNSANDATITAILHETTEAIEDRGEGRYKVRRRVIEVSGADVSAPDITDYFTIDSEKWGVVSFGDNDWGMVTIAIARPEMESNRDPAGTQRRLG